LRPGKAMSKLLVAKILGFEVPTCGQVRAKLSLKVVPMDKESSGFSELVGEAPVTRTDSSPLSQLAGS
jgi:hypothetical protein